MGRWAYAASAVVGAALAWSLFPLDFLWPVAGRDWRPVGDAAQHAIAQRHFLADAWRWPPLAIATLQGVNLAFLDGIPAQALGLKALRGVWPEGFHGIGLFYLLAWVVQPIAAVWALRSAGVRDGWAGLAAALLAVALPAFVMRFGHAALNGHFVILVALGLYFRLVRDGRWWALAVPWQVLALLIHPYLALMVLSLLAAVPLTRALRGGPGVLPALLGAGGAAAAMGMALWVFGYLGATGEGGYGDYALNLAGPFWPRHSLLLDWLVSGYPDATGHGGWEGYNWLGLGLWMALAAALVMGRGRGGPWRHAGLVLALLGLTALALSFRIGLGGRMLLDLGPAPAVLEQFRASGRFFWPVAYALLLGAAAALAARGPVGIRILLVCGLVQLADAQPMRAALAAWAAERTPWQVEAGALRPLLREAGQVTLLPSWPCIEREDAAARVRILELLLLASETPRPVSTMYAARWRTPPVCADAVLAARPLAPGELRVALPQAAGLLTGSGCGLVGDLTVCR